MMKCIFNGQIKDQSEVSLPIHDIALVRGYGIFDFFRLSGGVPLFIDDHLDRFYRSAERARLTLPVEREELLGLLNVMFELNSMPVSGVRLILTGGTGNGPYAIGEPNFIITQESFSFPTHEMLANGVKLITHDYLRDLPEIKTINYMTGIWLQQRIAKAGAFDVLYVHQGKVHELTRSNIFIINSHDQIVTPNQQVLYGITRKQLIRSLGIVEERPIPLEELAKAKEVFATGTGKKVLPICAINDWQYSSASEDSRTREIMELFDHIEADYIKRRLQEA